MKMKLIAVLMLASGMLQASTEQCSGLLLVNFKDGDVKQTVVKANWEFSFNHEDMIASINFPNRHMKGVLKNNKAYFSGNGSKVVAETIVNTNGRFITVNIKNYEGSRISDTSSGVLECNVKI